ncbi:MAG: hypothetical protein LBG79_02460 [Spirochaetaceae bacterium]|jgi:hypothetical protein|nr:hypothetical protein [Spirochaetaceae bacterium]
MTAINIASGAVYTRGLQVKDKLQLYGMALVFLVLLYNSPAGLVFYWTLNNVFSLVKNIYFKIRFPGKRKIVSAFILIICAFMIFYVLAVHHGDISVRMFLAVIFALIILIALISPFVKKIFAMRHVIPENRSGFFETPNSKQTFAVFISSFFVIWLLFGISTPTQLIAASPQEFSFIDNYTSPFFFIFNTGLQVSGFFLFWGICLYFLFPAKIKKHFAFAGMILCACFLCDTFLFSGSYGLISVNLVFAGDVRHSLKSIIINILALCIPSGILAFLYFSKWKNIIPVVFGICAVSLAGLSFVNAAAIQKELAHLASYSANKEMMPTQTKPILQLSKTGKNVVVIMLDRAISVFVPYILEEAPELKKDYSGFIYYPNTVSFNGYTAIGSPPIFGGYEYTPEEINKRDSVPLVEKHNQALLMMPRIFSENGFAVTATDPPYANYNQKTALDIYEPYPDVKAYITDSVYTDLWLLEHNLSLPSASDILKRNMFYYSVFKGLPLAFRRAFYAKGNWCATVYGQSLRLTLNGYAVLDYLPQLTAIQNEEKGALLLLTNNTTHETSFLQAPEYRPKLQVSDYGTSKFKKEAAYHINIASLKRLADWFAFLKTENLYDNTKIIIVSDHGPQPNFVTKIGLPFNVDQFNPLLMVKDFNASGDITTDMAFMSNADVPSLALQNILDGAVNPFTGNAVTMENKKSPLYIAMSGSIHLQRRQATRFTLNPALDYYVHDDIFKPKNWIRADSYENGSQADEQL